MKDTTLLETTELAVMASGGWGTINARSVSAAAALSTYVGAKHALLCHSYDAAYESLIRHFGAAHGDRIAVGELCEPADAIVPVCVGAMPAFTRSTGKRHVRHPQRRGGSWLHSGRPQADRRQARVYRSGR